MTSKNLCGSCKHWKRVSEPFDIEYHGAHTGTCKSKSFVYQQRGEVPVNGLAYYDYESYSAGFYTGEAFGCIHWKKKDGR